MNAKGVAGERGPDGVVASSVGSRHHDGRCRGVPRRLDELPVFSRGCCLVSFHVCECGTIHRFHSVARACAVMSVSESTHECAHTFALSKARLEISWFDIIMYSYDCGMTRILPTFGNLRLVSLAS